MSALQDPTEVGSYASPLAGSLPMPRTASVIVCAHTQLRWPQILRVMCALRQQTVEPHQVVMVIDHEPELLSRCEREFPWAQVMASSGPKGLSGARNTGVDSCIGDIVAFVDDDATPDADWLERLLAAFGPSVVAVGGSVSPDWEGRCPDWFPEEFSWVIGCSWTGLPAEPAPVRNPIGANMAFRRFAFEHIGQFTPGIGRDGRLLAGCEETELCIRVRQMWDWADVMYDPAIHVSHWVSPDRSRFSYFARRCYGEGMSKALVQRSVGAKDGLASERAYTTRVLPRGVLRNVRRALSGDRGGYARAAAIVAGFAITATGYGSTRARMVIAPARWSEETVAVPAARVGGARGADVS